MPEARTSRVMWLLNHSTARDFEIPMLRKLGFAEFFLPKKFPQSTAFRSASVDFSEDAALTIPRADLDRLNEADWYGEIDRATWDVANRYFDVLFFMPWSPSFFGGVARHFQGAAILRAYGWLEGHSCGGVVNAASGGKRTLVRLGRRFWFGSAYDHLAAVEPPWIQEREVYLPVGLQDCRAGDEWSGSDPRVLFMCPDLEANPYYKEIYREFKRHFEGTPYAIGGVQSVASNDPHVLGFVSAEQHQRNMREFRVMFYDSKEPRLIKYTPFEAVREGMPLVFMGGGLLDRLGGIGLPGRCEGYREAREKLRRILGNDQELIAKIRRSQTRLLDAMRPETLEPAWRRGMTEVLAELDGARMQHPGTCRRRRIAVMLPVAYRGGTLRSAKLLAQALWIGSRQAGEDADVVFGYPEPETGAPEAWDSDLPDGIQRRTIKWRKLDDGAALRAMRFGGDSDWEPATDAGYLIPDDGVQQMCDCDLWIVISDRLSGPLLPIRPHLLVVYDYVQRYDPGLSSQSDAPFLAAARGAERVLVTTRFTEQDALTYAGVSREKVVRVPMLLPEFPPEPNCPAEERYFLWSTNLARHKNHVNAMSALREYYGTLGGRLECRVTGVNTESLLEDGMPHLEPAAENAEARGFRKRLRILGELPECSYRRQLSGAQFLWHPAQIDNGTLSVVEAALLGVPSLSSRYPAMEEMDAAFGLHLTWMDWAKPGDMARKLKFMEEHAQSLRSSLPCAETLSRFSAAGLAGQYWSVIRECL